MLTSTDLGYICQWDLDAKSLLRAVKVLDPKDFKQINIH